MYRVYYEQNISGHKKHGDIQKYSADWESAFISSRDENKNT